MLVECEMKRQQRLLKKPTYCRDRISKHGQSSLKADNKLRNEKRVCKQSLKTIHYHSYTTNRQENCDKSVTAYGKKMCEVIKIITLLHTEASMNVLNY